MNEDNKARFSVYDVVLPLPGHDVILPSNDTRVWYEELLQEDGLTMNSFHHHIKYVSLSLLAAVLRMSCVCVCLVALRVGSEC